jgi:hypothetical protein
MYHRHQRLDLILLETQPIVQPLQNFTAFHGTRGFITVFTRALHWSLSSARSIQSISSHLISLKILSNCATHLHLGLPSCLFLSFLLSYQGQA